jgi:hypothetical protein
MTFATTYNLWNIAGMVYALAGAALLCNAVFSIPAGFSYAAASQVKPLTRHEARRLNGQWLDMRFGSGLLVIGFFLQITGALGTATLNTPAIFVLLALALLAGYYALAKDLIADRLVNDSAVETATPLLAPPASAAQTLQTSPAEIPGASMHPAPAEPQAVAAVAHVVEIVETKQESAA